MGKLHEMLAVEGNLKGQAGKTRAEVMKTLADKRHLFSAKLVTYTPDEEMAPAVTEAQSDIQTTLAEELHWLSGIQTKWWNAGYQIDVANTMAKADVQIEDESVAILKDVPTTFLLQLGHRLEELHELLVAIPTLDPAKGFQPDTAKEAGVYRAHDVRKFRTKKVFTPLVLAPATDKHPAQVKEGFEDKAVGTILEQEWSSLITPNMKSDLLDRCDKLIRAVKKARAVANGMELEVPKENVGQKLLGYIFAPLPKKKATEKK
jgi:hypothetical protein